MANKAPQNIELVHFDKQPINSNCLSLYQMTDEDTKNIEFPTNIFKLASNPTVLLENCFSEAEKVRVFIMAGTPSIPGSETRPACLFSA